MKSIRFSKLLRVLPACFLAVPAPAPSRAQTSAQVVTVTPHKASGKRGGVMEAKVSVHIQAGYHANSNKPNDDYLIPMKLTWDPQPFEVAEVLYPAPQTEKYEFSEKPLSVYTGDIELLTKFKLPQTAASGLGAVNGKLRYQVCTEKMCLPPKTADVRLVYTIN